MIPSSDVDRRNRLAYLALHCAIQGDEVRSEQIRRMVRLFDGRDETLQWLESAEGVPVTP